MSKFQAWHGYSTRERGCCEWNELDVLFDTLEEAIYVCKEDQRERSDCHCCRDSLYEITELQTSEIVWSDENGYFQSYCIKGRSRKNIGVRFDFWNPWTPWQTQPQLIEIHTLSDALEQLDSFSENYPDTKEVEHEFKIVVTAA